MLFLLLSLLQAPKDADNLAVEAVTNLAYQEGREADADRHRLDLYTPQGRKDFPVLLFVHGGGWKNGNKEQFEFLGRTLARHGIGVVLVNYRLYPTVKFPENMKDVAKAVKWVRENIAQYG